MKNRRWMFVNDFRFLLALGVFLSLVFTKNAFALAPPGLLLWNKLGSDTEVLGSAFGPNLSFFTGSSDRTGYAPAVFGGGVTIGGGPFGGLVHNLVLEDLDSLISPERGAIEAWYKQAADPLPFSYGIYRLFDGDFGLGSGLGLESFTPTTGPFAGLSRLFFTLTFDGTRTEIAHDISAYNDTWIHVAAAWDRDGIEGSAETMQLYVNGVKVAASTAIGWGTTLGPAADIAGGNDSGIAGKFFLDNLKLWDFAKTDYSDRFIENFMKEIAIDIAPHSEKNTIAIRERFVRLAILSDDSFDAPALVDPLTVTFGKTGEEESLVECEQRPIDVNRDGMRDLICLFSLRDTGLQGEDAIARLMGKTPNGLTEFFGEDGIRIVAASNDN